LHYVIFSEVGLYRENEINPGFHRRKNTWCWPNPEAALNQETAAAEDCRKRLTNSASQLKSAAGAKGCPAAGHNRTGNCKTLAALRLKRLKANAAKNQDSSPSDYSLFHNGVAIGIECIEESRLTIE
jgi:hypothetical protein